MRQCMTCHNYDLSSRYDSPEDAAADGMWEREWACRLCRQWGFDLVPETRLIMARPTNRNHRRVS